MSTATSTTTEIAARLRLAVGRLARSLRHQDRSGLPLTLSAAVATIARRGPLTLGELATCEQVAPPTITRVVARLEEQGLVTRRIDRDDRRVARVELTARGKRQLESDRKRRVAWLASRLGELDADERDRLAAALDVLEQLASAPQADT